MPLSTSQESLPTGIGSLPAPIDRAIVRTVAYVDIFDYPPAESEIHRYLIGVAASPSAVKEALFRGKGAAAGLERRDGFFTLAGRTAIVDTRRRREAASQRLWPAAIHYGRLMARLPFVRMVAVTGSLAVNNAEADADIDYLIVTANDRLWLGRAFTILVVRLAARQKLQLCPNYLLSERALVFSERNLYTAHELVQMIPLSGLSVYKRIRRLNKWTERWLPNAIAPPSATAESDRITADSSHIRRLTEKGLNAGLGERLEQWEMRRKVAKFTRQAAIRQRNNGSAVEVNFGADWCKGHFGGHSRRVLDAYARRMETLEQTG